MHNLIYFIVILHISHASAWRGLSVYFKHVFNFFSTLKDFIIWQLERVLFWGFFSINTEVTAFCALLYRIPGKY